MNGRRHRISHCISPSIPIPTGLLASCGAVLCALALLTACGSDDGETSAGTGGSSSGVGGSSSSSGVGGGVGGGGGTNLSPAYVGVPAIDFGGVIGDCRTTSAPSWPAAWPAAEATDYYYVDNTHPAATDTANPNGYPDRPRLTLAAGPFGPGTYVELHGGPYAQDYGTRFQCSAADPCWLRGTAGDLPIIHGGMGLAGSSYLMVENLDFNGGQGGCLSVGSSGVQEDTHHVCIRHNFCRNRAWPGGNAVAMGGNPANGTKNHHIVFYDNEFTDIASEVSWDDGVDRDFHAIGVGAFGRDSDSGIELNDWWIVQNRFTRVCGNGVQLIGQNISGSDPKGVIHHIYVAGNSGSDNRQSLVGLKMASDVIVSQNHAWGNRAHSAAFGDGFMHQYGATRVWFLLNEAHDVNYGIRSSEGGEAPWVAYYLGNLLYDCKNFDGNNSWGNYDGIGIYLMRGASVNSQLATRYVAFNTIYGCRDGIVAQQDHTPLYAWSNLISGVGDGNSPLESPQGRHIAIANNSADAATIDFNFFDASDSFRVAWGGTEHTSLGALQAATGQESNGMVGAPSFVNPTLDPTTRNFDLDAGSEAIDACSLAAPDGHDPFAEFQSRYGIDILKDFLERGRVVGTVDCGAYEAQN